MDGRQIHFLVNGHGGLTGHLISARREFDGGPTYGRLTSTTTGKLYANEHAAPFVREHRDEFTPDALYVNYLAAPKTDRALVGLVLLGPMLDDTVPAGHLKTITGDLVPFDATPVNPRAPFIGNAGSLDYAAPDVYAAIVRAAGFPVVPVRSVFAHEFRDEKDRCDVCGGALAERDAVINPRDAYSLVHSPCAVAVAAET